MTSSVHVQAFLQAPAKHARFHVYELPAPGVDARAALHALRAQLDTKNAIVGIGQPLALQLGAHLKGLRDFPAISGAGVSAPSTQGALFISLDGDDPGTLHHQSRALTALLAPAFRPTEVIDAFTHREGRDLTGYEDGTENPKGAAAAEAAVITGRGAGLDGGSFVAFQRWAHDLDAFAARTQTERDHTIGRRLRDNKELPGAPVSAHVKRSAQESFDPPAFILRRSLPYVTPAEQGLCFVAYGESLDRFERILRRMLGLDDGITDGLFGFTSPRSGGYYFCPPLRGHKLDLRALGL